VDGMEARLEFVICKASFRYDFMFEVDLHELWICHALAPHSLISDDVICLRIHTRVNLNILERALGRIKIAGALCREIMNDRATIPVKMTMKRVSDSREKPIAELRYMINTRCVIKNLYLTRRGLRTPRNGKIKSIKG